MPYDSQGKFTRVMNWQDDAANGVNIVASRHDDEDDNFAQGFNEVLCRDGRAAMTGSLKMGSFKITGLANGTNNNDAINKSQLDGLNTTITAAINTAITNCKNALFPVGGIYATIGNTNPNSLLGFGTWDLITSSIVTGASNSPVWGDGKSLMWTNDGSTAKSAGWNANGGYNAVSAVGADNTQYTLPDTSISNINTGWNTGKPIGVITKEIGEEKSVTSGLYADLQTTAETIYIWKRTA